jgi:hypothetical protein
MSKAGGNTSASENWKYVCQSVRAIFAHLQQARSTVYGTKEVDNMIWGCLQGRMAAKKMLSILFRKHSVVLTVLNDHLQQSAIMRDEFEGFIKMLKETIKQSVAGSWSRSRPPPIEPCRRPARAEGPDQPRLR